MAGVSERLSELDRGEPFEESLRRLDTDYIDPYHLLMATLERMVMDLAWQSRGRWRFSSPRRRAACNPATKDRATPDVPGLSLSAAIGSAAWSYIPGWAGVDEVPRRELAFGR